MKTKFILQSLMAVFILSVFPVPLSAHCDSYDGPLIKEALKAIETNQVTPVLKWVEPKYEEEITNLFNKTISTKNGDREIYEIVKKHFLETLVRFHREGEGAPFTGLKPAGSASKIILLADEAIIRNDIGSLINMLNQHLSDAVAEKYNHVAEKAKNKDNSTAEGREYVSAYVEYTHYLEALHNSMNGEALHAGHAE